MNNLTTRITDILSQGKSVVLVGPTGSGKTFWVQNTLIPHLESLGKKVEYLKNGATLPKWSPDIVICDEVETLFDRDYLEEKVSRDYYSDEYLKTISGWYKNYSRLPVSTLFVTTRNEPNWIKNLIANMHQADWDNRDITVLKFER